MKNLGWFTKRLVLTVLVLMALLYFFPSSTSADQLAWLQKDQAQRAIDVLQSQEHIILYCGCCNEEQKTVLRIQEVYIRHPTINGKEYPQYYEVVVKGMDVQNKEPLEQSIDLAYTHIKKKQKAVCLGKQLRMDCDPCVKPFHWPLD